MSRSRLAPPQLFLVTVLTCSIIQAAHRADAAIATDQELQVAHAWAAAHITPEADEAAVTAPFSFIYQGTPSSELLPQWKHERKRDKLDPQRTRCTLVWTDPESELQVRCVGI